MLKIKGYTVWRIALLIVLIMLILTIVGVCTAWVTRVITLFGQESWSLAMLSGRAEYAALGSFSSVLGFAVLTIIFTVAIEVFIVITRLIDKNIFRVILLVVCAACFISGLACIIATVIFCNQLIDAIPDVLVSAASPAAGAWLTSICGMIAGVVGALAAFKI